MYYNNVSGTYIPKTYNKKINLFHIRLVRENLSVCFSAHRHQSMSIHTYESLVMEYVAKSSNTFEYFRPFSNNL